MEEEAGASSRNFLAGGGVAGSMSWEDLFCIEVYVINLRSMTEATKIGLAGKSIKLCPKN